jgi:hypothetical protein
MFLEHLRHWQRHLADADTNGSKGWSPFDFIVCRAITGSTLLPTHQIHPPCPPLIDEYRGVTSRSHFLQRLSQGLSDPGNFTWGISFAFFISATAATSSTILPAHTAQP